MSKMDTHATSPRDAMKVLVCGGREYADARTVNATLDDIQRTAGISRVIEGCAPGADHLAELWARSSHVNIWHFPADWEKHGRAAGPIRNRRMLVEGLPDLVVAFPGGRGTAHMVKLARNAGVPVQEV